MSIYYIEYLLDTQQNTLVNNNSYQQEITRRKPYAGFHLIVSQVLSSTLFHLPRNARKRHEGASKAPVCRTNANDLVSGKYISIYDGGDVQRAASRRWRNVLNERRSSLKAKRY